METKYRFSAVCTECISPLEFLPHAFKMCDKKQGDNLLNAFYSNEVHNYWKEWTQSSFKILKPKHQGS